MDIKKWVSDPSARGWLAETVVRSIYLLGLYVFTYGAMLVWDRVEMGWMVVLGMFLLAFVLLMWFLPDRDYEQY